MRSTVSISICCRNAVTSGPARAPAAAAELVDLALGLVTSCPTAPGGRVLLQGRRCAAAEALLQ